MIRNTVVLLVLAISAGGASGQIAEPTTHPAEPTHPASTSTRTRGAGAAFPAGTRRTKGMQPTPEAIAAALGRYRHEPGVQTVVAAVLRASGGDPARMEAMADRARAAGWVPRVQLSGRRGQAVDLSSASRDGALRASTDDDLMLQASLTFDLPRVVFSRSEIGIAAEARSRHAVRRALIAEVVGLYFERRRLQLQRDLLGDADLSLHARLLELHALLDAFTNGALSRMMGDPKHG